MTMPSEQQMITAVSERDASYDGQFIYGVVTTGVFCLLSCSSKSANAENLRFFVDIESAMNAGFRPCQRCKLAGGDRQLERLIQIARHIEQHADERLTLATLAQQAELSPSRFQRVFKQAFGISAKVYQDVVRLRRFKQSLQQGDGITDAIYASGYGSVSRVYGEAARHIGMAPKAYRAGGEGEHISYACRQTVLGYLMMAATDKGVCFAQFGDSEQELLTLLKAEFSNAQLQPSSWQQSPQLDAWVDALDQHISNDAPRPELPLDMRGTVFQMRVWQFLLSIKEGEVFSYSEVADGIDQPKAVRAVASACGKNCIGVLIPCHRVLRSDGSLGGYRWGLERKRALLAMEKDAALR